MIFQKNKKTQEGTSRLCSCPRSFSLGDITKYNELATAEEAAEDDPQRCFHGAEGRSWRSPSLFFATKMVFPKSMKSRNSGSEAK